MTDRQIEVLRFIHRAHQSHGLPPTIREICDHFGWASTNTAADHLASLRKDGALEEQRNRARWLLLTNKGRRAIGLDS